MNYVNKENAIALKELGFDVPTSANYQSGIMLFSGASVNHNEDLYSVSAPDFLTAADWLFENHQLEFMLRPNHTRIFDWWDKYGIPLGEREFSEQHGDHRNAAITYAINQIKNLNNETQS